MADDWSPTRTLEHTLAGALDDADFHDFASGVRGPQQKVADCFDNHVESSMPLEELFSRPAVTPPAWLAEDSPPPRPAVTSQEDAKGDRDPGDDEDVHDLGIGDPPTEDCKSLQRLFRKPWQSHVVQTLSRAIYYAERGRLVCCYLPGSALRRYLAEYRALLANHGYPLEARDALDGCLDVLAALMPAQLAQEAEDGAERDETKAQKTITALLVLFSKGKIHVDFRKAPLLKDIESLLTSDTGLANKLTVLSLARAIWPWPRDRFAHLVTNSHTLQVFYTTYETVILRNVYFFEEASEHGQVGGSDVGRLPGFEDYNTLEQNISADEARAQEDAGKRLVAPKNDDVNAVKLQEAHYVESILIAMALHHDERDDYKDKQWLQTKMYLTEQRIPYEYLERKAVLIFGETISLHENGCKQERWHDPGLGSKADNDIKCSKLLDLIMEALGHKSILQDALRHDGLLDLVVAPSKMMKDKISFNKNNKGRAETNRKRQEMIAQHRDGDKDRHSDSDDDNEPGKSPTKSATGARRDGNAMTNATTTAGPSKPSRNRPQKSSRHTANEVATAASDQAMELTTSCFGSSGGSAAGLLPDHDDQMGRTRSPPEVYHSSDTDADGPPAKKVKGDP